MLMKHLFALLLAFVALAPRVMGQATTPTTVLPTFNLVTPTAVLNGKGTILGNAEGGSITGTGTGATAQRGTVKFVFYKNDGEKKWKKAKLTRTTTAVTVWMFKVKGLPSAGRRILIYVEDSLGLESNIVGARFRNQRG
jgi:hypothetical protein